MLSFECYFCIWLLAPSKKISGILNDQQYDRDNTPHENERETQNERTMEVQRLSFERLFHKDYWFSKGSESTIPRIFLWSLTTRVDVCFQMI